MNDRTTTTAPGSAPTTGSAVPTPRTDAIFCNPNTEDDDLWQFARDIEGELDRANELAEAWRLKLVEETKLHNSKCVEADRLRAALEQCVPALALVSWGKVQIDANEAARRALATPNAEVSEGGTCDS